jgi:hypothetical protein
MPVEIAVWSFFLRSRRRTLTAPYRWWLLAPYALELVFVFGL